MIPVADSIFTFQIGGFYGGNIGNLLLYWEQAGFFSYILPFLLIFAIVFGILTRTKIFGDQNRGLNAVISISIGLLALQFNFVPIFFSEIFPRLGIGLSVILVLLILIGMFIPAENNKYANWLLMIVAVIIFLIVIGKSFGTFYWWTSVYNWYLYSPEIITVIIVIAALAAVIAGASGRRPQVPNFPQPVWRAP